MHMPVRWLLRKSTGRILRHSYILTPHKELTITEIIQRETREFLHTTIISWVRRDGASVTKFWFCHGQHSSFAMVITSPPANSRALLPMTSKADMLPLETEPVARDNNTSWTLKPVATKVSSNLTQPIIAVNTTCQSFSLGKFMRLHDLWSSASQITRTSNFFSFGLDTNWDCTVE